MPRPLLACLALCLSASGCVTVAGAGGTVTDVRTVRRNGVETQERRTELDLPTSLSFSAASATPQPLAAAEPFRAAPPAAFPLTPPLVPGEVEYAPSASRRLGLSARWVGSRIWTRLTTDFRSPSFANLSWERQPATYGSGPEAALSLMGDEGQAVDLAVGGARSVRQTNAHKEGGLYVLERTHMELYWLSAAYRHPVARWLYLKGGAGGFAYHLDTALDTNVPSFVYDSQDVTRYFAALGVGGGVQTPWDAPLRLFAGADFWLPLEDVDTLFEWGVGQVSAGAALRF